MTPGQDLAKNQNAAHSQTVKNPQTDTKKTRTKTTPGHSFVPDTSPNKLPFRVAHSAPDNHRNSSGEAGAILSTLGEICYLCDDGRNRSTWEWARGLISEGPTGPPMCSTTTAATASNADSVERRGAESFVWLFWKRHIRIACTASQELAFV